MNLRDLSDEQLVHACIENNRGAWEEFFRRFIPALLGAIESTLRSYDRYDLLNDEDVIWEIHEKIVEKLYCRGILAQCRDPSAVENWLGRVAENQTRDWLNKQARRKRLPEREAEKSKIPLSTPLGRGGRATLEILVAESGADGELSEYLEKALDELSDIPGEKKLWALRLSLLHYWPLTTPEIENLAHFTGYAVHELEGRLRDIMSHLVEKEIQRAKDFNSAVILWLEIRNRQARLREIRKNSSEEGIAEAKALEEEMEKKSKRRDALMNDSLIRPSNEEIGKILGLPEDKAQQVSNLLLRAREALQTRLAKRFASSSNE